MAEPDIASEEYRAQAVAWYLSSEKTIAEIADSLNLSESLIREWVWNASPEDVSDNGTPEAEAAGRAEAEAKAGAAQAQGELEALRVELEAARAEIAVLVAAEAAAREEIRAVYAEAVEAIIRIEAAAEQRITRANADTAEAVTQPQPVAAEALASARSPARSEAEAEARAKIAEVMARAAPVELWVHATGRTLEAARAEALDRLGVDETRAEVEVLSHGSRWLPGGVRVRARVRVPGNSRS